MRKLTASFTVLLLASCGEDLSKVDGPPPEGASLRGNSVVASIEPKEPEPEPEPFDEEGYETINFDLLGEFEYPVYVKIKEGEELPEIPEEVRTQNGKKIKITGFMNPVRFDREGVSEFLLVKDILGCCFGATPKMNHWIRVRMKEGERAKFYAYDQLTVLGEFEVSEEVEDGYVMSIYRMTVDHLTREE
ncbi:MAG: DUF3299 domain-containing protein [Planctomycetes bacterium]|nr:DUF3299 domain-containing protein [Planctomycetota bacterium]